MAQLLDTEWSTHRRHAWHLADWLDAPQRIVNGDALVVDFLRVADHARDRTEPAGHAQDGCHLAHADAIGPGKLAKVGVFAFRRGAAVIPSYVSDQLQLAAQASAHRARELFRDRLLVAGEEHSVARLQVAGDAHSLRTLGAASSSGAISFKRG